MYDWTTPRQITPGANVWETAQNAGKQQFDMMKDQWSWGAQQANELGKNFVPGVTPDSGPYTGGFVSGAGQTGSMATGPNTSNVQYLPPAPPPGQNSGDFFSHRDWANTGGGSSADAQWKQQMAAMGGASGYNPGIANDPNGGGSIGSNPYMQGQVDYFSNQYGKQLEKGLQGIRSNFVGAGGLGGSRQGVAEGQAIGDSMIAYGGNLADFLSGNYQFDRNLNTNSYNTNRGLDLQQGQLGLQAANFGLQAPWIPYNNVSSNYSNYTGLGSQSTPGQGGGWQGALGGLLGGAQLGKNLGWW